MPAGPGWADTWDLAPCGYLILSDDGTVLAANRTVLTELGRDRSEVVGRLRFADLLSPGGRIYYETHLMPMLHMTNRVAELALDLRCADGRNIPVLLNAQRHAPDGGPATIHVITFDAQQRRDYEREILAAKKRAEASEATARELSRTLQATFIPPLPPVVDGLDLAAAYRPAGIGTEVGGDFYDIVQLADREWMITIGDVEGKGVGAATVTALARHVLRAAAVRSRSPGEALRTLNDVLRHSETTRLLTALVLHLVHVEDGWHAVVASGGHERPVLRRRGETPRELDVQGTILGALAAPSLIEHRFTMGADDLLLLTTDGVQEARNPQTGEFFGLGRLLHHLDPAASPGVSTVVESLVADVLQFSHGVGRDDLAVVGVQVGRDVTPAPDAVSSAGLVRGRSGPPRRRG